MGEEHRQQRGYKGLQGWPTARDSGCWQLAGETKPTSVETYHGGGTQITKAQA